MTSPGANFVVDTDSHVTEPADLWTSRVSSRFGDAVPHVRPDPAGFERWFIGNEPASPWGMFAVTDYPEHFPAFPFTVADADPATYDAKARLAKLDENGVDVQLLYPNLVGFMAARFMSMDPALGIACNRAYNDFLTEFCSADDRRLVPLTTLPFWDVDESIAEMERGAEMGHRGVLFAHTFAPVGLPDLPDERWWPILDAAQSLGQSINFHVGFAGASTKELEEFFMRPHEIPPLVGVTQGALSFMSNARAITMLTAHGVCHRFPRLKFVCVESAFGWIPYLLQSLDWFWDANGMVEREPGRLRPSEYFERQIYATMWFEKPAAEHLERWQNNLMWETDYPHPAAQWPTPASPTPRPADEAIEQTLGQTTAAIRSKILFENAARLYRLVPPR